MNVDRFRSDVTNSPLMDYNNLNVTELSELYENSLSSLLELHAPLKKAHYRTIVVRPASPWYTDEIITEKVKRRRLERLWRKNKLTINRESYVEQCNLVNRLIHQSRMQYYSALIKENSSNQAGLFTTVDKMLNRKEMNKLPSYDDALGLANKFGDFFREKVQNIRNGFLSMPSVATEYHSIPSYTGQELNVFNPTTIQELSTLLRNMITKSCMLDPIPGSILKDCFDVLLPVITRIINLSFTSTISYREASVCAKLCSPSSYWQPEI